MARIRPSFSDNERERLRKALSDYADHYELSAQKLSDLIAVATGYPLEFDAGRKRVERFLKADFRQPDDFIAAICQYLGSVPPPDIEQMASSLAHFFARDVPRPVSIDDLAGRYQAWISTDRRPEEGEGLLEVTVFDGMEFKNRPPQPMARTRPYAIIEMRPMEKSDALMVSEAIINAGDDLKLETFPDELPPLQDAGIIVAFGYSDRIVPRYLMTTRTVLETRLYRLFRAGDDPLTLRGELNYAGGIGRSENLTHSDPLHPDYGIELVKIG